MKNKVLVLGMALLTACGTSLKLAVPDTFRQQATMQHVSGARGNKMSFANFSTSRIKRGIHVSYPGWGPTRGFFLENLLLNKVGIQVGETIENEKAKFRYTITDGKKYAAVYAREKQVTKKLEIEMTRYHGLFSGFEQLQHYNYVFSALISADTMQQSKDWELLMTNVYDREAEHDRNPFTFIEKRDAGLATNGSDTIFIHPLNIRKTETADGRTAQLPFKKLSGYELSTSAGVVAIVDLIDRNIWFYNELDATEKLNISAIATAILARKVNDGKW